MTGLHHRDPGLVGAALLTDLYTELIADNVHVHPDLYELIHKMKGDKRMILITDAMKGQCMKQGNYDLGGQTVIVGKDDARLENGTLAGSILTQDKAFRHILNTNGIDLVLASRMLSANPSELLALKNIGSIKQGNCADLVLLNSQMAVTHTLVDGQVVYQK
jgi:N-acetylglucosamine-6-phosphate deacetylase